MKFYHTAWFWLILVPAFLSSVAYCIIPSPTRADNFGEFAMIFIVLMSFGQGIKYMSENGSFL